MLKKILDADSCYFFNGESMRIRGHSNRFFAFFLLGLLLGSLVLSWFFYLGFFGVFFGLLFLFKNPFEYDVAIVFYPMASFNYKHHLRFEVLGLVFFVFNYRLFCPRFEDVSKVDELILQLESRSV